MLPITAKNAWMDDHLTSIKQIRHDLEASTESVPWEKVFLEILQNSQEKVCARVYLLIKLQASGLQPY